MASKEACRTRRQRRELGGWLALCVGWSMAAAETLPPKPPLKPPLGGLLYIGDIRFNRQDGGIPALGLDEVAAAGDVFDGLVVNLTWAQLQPDPERLDTAALDAALAKVRQFNAQHPDRRLALRLRIWHGSGAPEWAKKLGGPPVAVRHRGVRVTVGRFWSGPYRSAWRRFQGRLGSRYDGESLIRGVSNTSCSSITSEPFVFPADPESLKNLKEAGFNDDDFAKCLLDAAQDYAAWPTTRIDYAFNPYRTTGGGKVRHDLGFTLRVMKDWRATLGERGVLSNDSVQFPPPAFLQPIYDEMKRLGPPIELQTHSPKGLAWEATVNYALSLGAGALELWGETAFGGYEDIAPETLHRWSAQFKKNSGK